MEQMGEAGSTTRYVSRAITGSYLRGLEDRLVQRERIYAASGEGEEVVEEVETD